MAGPARGAHHHAVNAALFSAAGLHARPLLPEQVPLLQRLFDDNAAYFQAINGRVAHADEAQVEFDERPPPHLSYTRHWMLGLFAEATALRGVVTVEQDLAAVGVWHTALFMLATALHGSGVAQQVHAAQEAWMRASGARWLRLVVVVGNARAERFWQRCGYVELRRRLAVDTGGRLNDARVMIKPLSSTATPAAEIEAYLEHVPRDRPDSTLP